MLLMIFVQLLLPCYFDSRNILMTSFYFLADDNFRHLALDLNKEVRKDICPHELTFITGYLNAKVRSEVTRGRRGRKGTF